MINSNVVDKCCGSNGVIHQTCCKTCHNCPNCYDLSFDRINGLIYSIENTLADSSENYICFKKWGFSKPYLSVDVFKKLVSYREVLGRYQKSLLTGISPCLCDKEVQEIIEDSQNYIDISCTTGIRCDIIVEDNPKWLITNPTCLAYEVWESRMYSTLPKIGIKVENVSDAYALVYSISVNEIEDPYKLLYNLTVVNKAIEGNCFDLNIDVNKINCGLEYDLIVKSVEECKINFKTTIDEIKCDLKLSTRVKEIACKLDFNTYVKLLECNISTKVISEILKCGVGLRYNVKAKCGEIVLDKKVILLDEGFDVNILGEDVDLSLLESLAGANCLTTTPIDLSQEGYGN